MKWLESVYSDSTKYYVSNPYPKMNEKVTISLRMRKNEDVKKVCLRYREFGIEQIRPMTETVEDGILWFRTNVVMQEKRFHYQFLIVTENCIYYYTQYRITDYIPDESRDFVLLVDFQPAQWVKGTVFYQIFPERFCNGNPELSVKAGEYSYQGIPVMEVKEWNTPAAPYSQGKNVDFYGGDLEGIIQKLDYLQELGVNAIYLNPIFLSPSVHRYDSLDYFAIDPHLGGDEALERLTSELHKRGMRLLLDISINHTSSDAKWFNKSGDFYDRSIGAYHNPDAPEREFYFIDEDNSYDKWMGVETMPKLNFASGKLRDIIYRDGDSVLKKWLKAPYNIDGWRFDVADCLARNQEVDVHAEVLEEIRTYLKAEKGEAYLLAEDWVDCSEDLQGDRWDSTMNYYGCARPVREFVGEPDLMLGRFNDLRNARSKMTAGQLGQRIRQFYGKLPSAIQLQMFNLLDSHDVPRLHNNPAISKEEVETAILLMFTLPGTVNVYYGDEIALDGGIEVIEYARYPMDWSTEKSEEAKTRFAYYQKLCVLKKSKEALKDGGFAILSEEGYTFAFARFTTSEMLVTISSTDDKVSEVLLNMENLGFAKTVPTVDYFGKELQCEMVEEGVKISVPPHTSYLIIVEK